MLKMIHKIKPIWLIGLLATAVMLGSCHKDEDTDTSVRLDSFGPSPALRGGDLMFIGANLDKVSSIVLPDNVQVTSFKSKTATLIVIVVPEETVEGFVTLKTSDGDITTKTKLTISEPIKLTSFSPATARPGDVVTIEGEYLNLIKEVIFTNKKGVGDTAFVSQTKTKLEVPIPEEAQTGLIVISNGEAIPILVESSEALNVVLPSVTGMTPNPVKAGTLLTIQGTDLDLAKEVVFAGGARVSSFDNVTATELKLTVPANAKDGVIKLVAASLVETTSPADLVMVVPTISGLAPNPAKNGREITVSGSDLDLVTKVTFGGNKTGSIVSSSESELTIGVPIDAQEGTVAFTTAADKTVNSSTTLALVKPSITSLSPLSVQVNANLTISGEDLDLVTVVKFSGDKMVNVSGASETEINVIVPPGSLAGPITLVTTNGSEVTSGESLDILASTSAVITNMPTMAAPGDMISIIGENLDEITQLIFPGNVPATMFGQKTATLIEVFIPLDVARGVGSIILITADGQMFNSPEINIQGVEPIDDPTLVFFNFDDLGSWWGDAGGTENNASLTLDGSNYFHVNQSCNGWTGFFWRNGQNNFPGPAIATDVANYVLKFDINVLDPITGGEFAWRLKGSSGDFWYFWKPWQDTGTFQTNGWITVTIPLTSFYDGGNQLADLSTITEDFGVAFNNGTSLVNACIDNVRFEHL